MCFERFVHIFFAAIFGSFSFTDVLRVPVIFGLINLYLIILYN